MFSSEWSEVRLFFFKYTFRSLIFDDFVYGVNILTINTDLKHNSNIIIQFLLNNQHKIIIMKRDSADSFSLEFSMNESDTKEEQSIVDLLYQQGKKICYQAAFQIKLLISNAKEFKNVWLFGQSYNKKQQIENAFSKIIWLTYRQQMKGKVKSDVGWGCMIRVGQMFLAQSLRRYLIQENKQQSLINILTSFSDKQYTNREIGNYSIQKIMKQAEKSYDLKEGEWFNPSNISFILKTLHEEAPLRGTDNMKILITQGYIFFDDLLKILQKSKNTRIVIIILFVIGIKSSESILVEGIQHLMKIQYFNGMIGGRSTKAFYYIGVQEKDFLYLDPHFVQKGIKHSELYEINNLDSFRCPHLLSMNSEKINPSLGFSFYIRNKFQLIKLFNKLYDLKKSVSIPFSILKNENESYQPLAENQEQLQSQIFEIIEASDKARKKSEEFEELIECKQFNPLLESGVWEQI